MGKLQVGIIFPYKIPTAPTLRLPDFTSTEAARIKLWISLLCFIATHCITAPWVTGPANTYTYSQNKAWENFCRRNPLLKVELTLLSIT